MLYSMYIRALVLLIFVCCGDIATATNPEPKNFRQEVIEAPRDAVRPGDHCIVCGTMLQADDIVLIIRGRRVPLSAGMLKEFSSHPTKYFPALQPRGALFQEDMKGQEYDARFIVGGIIVVFVLVVGAFIGSRVVGPKKSQSEKRMTKVPNTEPPMLCGSCGSSMHPSAQMCTVCGASLKARYQSEVERA